jgi:hypothetical protein
MKGPERRQKMQGNDQRITESGWKGPGELPTMFGRTIKLFRSCIERISSCTEGPTELQKLSGKNHKNYTSCLKVNRRTTGTVRKGQEGLQKVFGKDQKN